MGFNAFFLMGDLLEPCLLHLPFQELPRSKKFIYFK